MNSPEINFRYPLMSGLLLFLLIACGHAPSKAVVYNSGHRTVRFVQAHDVRHCEMLASLIGETRSGEQAQAEYDLLRRIARVGGNCAVKDNVEAHGKHIMAYGQGYRCR